jgi:hypothetical protein
VHVWFEFPGVSSGGMSGRVKRSIVNEVGVFTSAGFLLSFVFAHLAVAILVAEIKVDKALVQDRVCRMVSRLSRECQCSLSSRRSSVRCV